MIYYFIPFSCFGQLKNDYAKPDLWQYELKNNYIDSENELTIYSKLVIMDIVKRDTTLN